MMIKFLVRWFDIILWLVMYQTHVSRVSKRDMDQRDFFQIISIFQMVIGGTEMT